MMNAETKKQNIKKMIKKINQLSITVDFLKKENHNLHLMAEKNEKDAAYWRDQAELQRSQYQIWIDRYKMMKKKAEDAEKGILRDLENVEREYPQIHLPDHPEER